jgi:hypothetical protein
MNKNKFERDFVKTREYITFYRFFFKHYFIMYCLYTLTTEKSFSF